MSINVNPNRLTDSNYAKEVYQSYIAQDGKYKVDKATVQEIKGNYSNRQIAQWESEVTAQSKDDNSYEIGDDEIDVKSLESSETTKNAVSGGAAVAGTASSAAVYFGGKSLLKQGTTLATEKGLKMITAGWMISCPISLAVGILYMATRPNKDAHEMLMKYNDLMLKYQEDIASGNVTLEQKQQEIEITQAKLVAETEEKQKEIEDYQEEQQNEIEKKQDEQAQLQETNIALADAINARVEVGEPISDSDKAKLDAANEAILTINAETQELAAETADTVVEMQSDAVQKVEVQNEEISKAQIEINDQATSIQEMEHTIEQVKSVDTKTLAMTIAQALAQTANAVSGFLNGAKAACFGPIGWVFAAMGFTGGGLSTAGAIEQGKFAVDIGKEIGVRKDTEVDVEKIKAELQNTTEKFDDAGKELDVLEDDLDNNQGSVSVDNVINIDNLEIAKSAEVPTEEITFGDGTNIIDVTQDSGSFEIFGHSEDSDNKKPEEE